MIELTILLSLPATPFGSRTVSVGTAASVTTYGRGSNGLYVPAESSG